MKLYDISKEIFSAAVFPGDPAPAFQPAQRLAEGDHCNLTQVTLGTHSATHMDAPWHFGPAARPSTRWSSPGAWGPARWWRPRACWKKPGPRPCSSRG